MSLINEEIKDNQIKNYFFHASEVLKDASDKLPCSIEQAASIILNAFNNGCKVLICGNGGSAADAQHFAAELAIHFEKTRRGLPAIALSTDSSILTAAGNDFGFDTVFSRQVEALGVPGDVLVAISTSGNSPNILKAVRFALDQGLFVIGLTGSKPSQLSQLSNLSISAPGDTTADVQVVHIVVIHAICKMIDSVY